MPAFNIELTHKYLVVSGIDKWTKTNSFLHAKQLASKNNDNIYENLNNHDWFILASNVRGKIVSEILGDLPNNNE